MFVGVSSLEDPAKELVNYPSLTLQELEELSWSLAQGTVFQLVAASSAGGGLDVILATGDPFDSSTHGIAAVPGSSPVSLQLITNSMGGYTTLVQGSLIGLAGDYDGNETVEPADYAVWRSSFGATGDSLPADGNGNEVVDAADYVIWRNNLGNSLFSGAVVPGAAIEQREKGEELSERHLLPARANRASTAELAVSFCPSTDATNRPLQRIAAELPTSTSIQRDEALVAWLADCDNVRPENGAYHELELLHERGGEIAELAVDDWDAFIDWLEPATKEFI